MDWTTLLAWLRDPATRPILGVLALLFLVWLWWRARNRDPNRRLEREARAAMRRRRWLDAAEAWRILGDDRQALECFIKAGAWLPAAEIAMAMGKKAQAASLYERAGRYLEAARLLEETRQYEAGAKLYERAGRYSEAAELYERIGDLEAAARAFRRAGQPARAGELLLKRRNFREAAEAFGEAFDAERSLLAVRELEPERREAIVALGRRAAELFEKIGAFERASWYWRSLGDPRALAAFFERRGQWLEAARLYEEVGDAKAAARAYAKGGERARASRLAAEEALGAGRYEQAGRLFLEAEAYDDAAEAFQLAGDLRSAAAAARKGGDLRRAAALLLKAKAGAEAARMLEEAGLYGEAAKVYQRLGEIEAMVRMLERAGRVYEAAVQLARAERWQEARALLDRNRDKLDRRALLLLGDLAARAGDADAAAEVYAEALGFEKVTAATLEAFYRYGRILERLERFEEARAIWEQLVRYDPKYKDAAERLRRLTEAAVPAEPPAPVAPRAAPESAPVASEATASSSPSTRTRGHGRYVVLDEIGRGGMGVVYKANDRNLDRIVALKVLPEAASANPTLIRKFIEEGRAAARLTHPNIVTVHDLGDDDGIPFIAMEYIEGRTLKEILKEEGPFPIPFLYLVAGHVAQGLAYAHKANVIHRDIKPSNLMWVPSQKVVKITDFGLARALQEMANFQTVVGGTPYYMAPEQILGDEVDGRSDIYSLGATLYELATGQVPFPKGDAGYHHIHTEPTPPRTLRPDLPEALERVILRCLRKDPAARYQSADELFAALQQARRESGN